MSGTPTLPALLPCPFCGHDTPEFERMGTGRQSCIVICGDCGARHESSDEYQRCGESWNTRAALASGATQPSEPISGRFPLPGEWVEWVEPYSDGSEAVYMRMSYEDVAKVRRKDEPRYESDQAAVDDFCVVHWARPLATPPTGEPLDPDLMAFVPPAIRISK